MSQRLGIAAALLGKPKYLMLDEPSNGLDPEGMAWLRHFIEDYAAQGNAVFISSHLLSELSQMVDNVVVIGKGKMLANTSIKELIKNNSKASVFIRSSEMKRLGQLLTLHKVVFQKADEGLLISGKTADEISILIYDARLPVSELTTRTASLEDAFLHLTENDQEYKTTTASKGE
jgi:ABC-2 type transport system ATP-binding protein